MAGDRTRPPYVLLEERSFHPTAFVAPGASVVGRVSLGARSSVWFAAVIRADMDRVELGEDSNLQDGGVIHVDEGQPTLIGRRVTIGHRAVVHAATVEDDCLIGMAAVVLSGARVGSGSLVAAGSLVREGQEIPAGSLVVGAPARILGPVKPEHTRSIARGVEHYVALAAAYRERGYACGWPAGRESLVQQELARGDEVGWAGALALLEAMPAKLETAVLGLDDASMRRPPGPGRWSVVEVVCHLRDAERDIFGPRFEQLLAAKPGQTPEFPVAGYDMNAIWARERRYAEDDLVRARAAFEAARAANLERIRALGPPDWTRTGIHHARGPVTLFEQVRRCAEHDLGHLRQIARTRREVGA